MQPDYEWQLCKNLLHNTTENYLTLDRTSDRKMVSVAATGMGFYSYAVAAHRGVIRKETASQWIKTGFDNVLKYNADYDGWLLHFIDITGKPVNDTEVSSVDTVLFYLSAEKAASLLKDNELLKYIRKCKNKIKLSAMMDSEGYFYHSFSTGSPRVMSKYKWKAYNEGIIIYKYFNKKFTPSRIEYDLPLFVYYYICAFYPEQEYVDILGKAIDFQIETTGRFGYTACDSFSGYAVNSPYIISPLAVYSCKKFFPDRVDKQLREWDVDPLLPAMTINKKWCTDDKIMIDQGIALILSYKE